MCNKSVREPRSPNEIVISITQREVVLRVSLTESYTLLFLLLLAFAVSTISMNKRGGIRNRDSFNGSTVIGPSSFPYLGSRRFEHFVDLLVSYKDFKLEASIQVNNEEGFEDIGCEKVTA